MDNRTIYHRITARARAIKDELGHRQFCLKGNCIVSTQGIELPLPDYLNDRVETYVFSRRGNRRKITRDISVWGYGELWKHLN